MKKLFVGLLLLGYAGSVGAQELPQKSPKAEIEQVIGLTEVEIEYSRPSKRDRVIFGELVPYGEMWRTGANARSTIEFDDPILIDGNKMEPGKYAILTIPEKIGGLLFLIQTQNRGGKIITMKKKMYCDSKNRFKQRLM